jgi:regulator of nonsense transcripts 2
MMRKKAVMALDSRYVTMIENAYYYVDPPEASPSQLRKERPPIHDYIRKLLYQDLCKPTTDKILRQMRKLNWDDPEILAYVVKCLTNVWNVRYLNIGCVASLLAGLVAYQVGFISLPF